MEAKQTCIQNAYGDHWNAVKDCVDPHGWINEDDLTYDMAEFKSEQIEFSAYAEGYWRVRGLTGVDDNNGWKRRDEQLPSKRGDYYVCINGKFDGEVLHSHEIGLTANPYDVTHWRPIDPVKPPIY